MSNELLVNAELDYETDPVLSPTVRATKPGQTDLVQVVPVFVGDLPDGEGFAAAILTRTTGATTYPPQVSFLRPIEWIDGDQAVMQWSADATFLTGVSETASPVTLLAGTVSYNFGLSAIVSGSRFIRMGAWRGTRPSAGNMTWSNVINVGDTTAPVLTGGGASSSNENLPLSVALSVSELAYITISGADAAELEPSTLGLTNSFTVRRIANANLNYEEQSSYSFIVTATDPAGNVSTPVSCTHTVVNQAENPSGQANFTTQTGVAVGTPVTSNTQVMSGLTSGYAAPFNVANGALIKNGVNVGAAGTIVNGDVWGLTGSAPAGPNSTEVISVDIGGDEPPVTVTFTVQSATTIPQMGALGFRFEALLPYLGQNSSGTTPVTADGDPVGYWADLSGLGRHIKQVGGSASSNPIFRVVSGINEVAFDGTNDILGWNGGDPGLYTASGYTAMWVGRMPTPVANKLMLGASNETVSQQYISVVASDSATASMGNSSMRSNAGSVFVAATVDHFASAWDGSNHVYIVVDDGSGITWYVDGVAGTRQTYTRSGNSITLTNLSVGGLWRGSTLSFSASRAQGVFVWPGVVLSAPEIAEATTYGGTLQGRIL